MPEASALHIRVEPTRGWVALKLRDLWQYRELLYFLAWRDIKVRYKQTTLGITWAIIQPALNTFIFTIVFGHFMNVRTGGLPYPVLVLSGMLPWQFFEQALNDAGNSVVGNSNLISKVYFPRLIAPLAGVIAAIPDFLVTFVLLAALLAWFHIVPGIAVLLLPAFLALAIITALGVGIWFAALNAQFRDFRYVMPFMVRFWFYASPTVYSATESITPAWRTVYGLNPMAGVIEGFRWALLGTRPPSMLILLSAAMAVLLLVSGLYFFRRVERSFADLI